MGTLKIRAGVVALPDKGLDISDTMVRNNVRRTEVGRLDSEMPSSPDDDEVICRQCRVAAQIELVDDQVHSIACPSCGVSLEGDAALEVVLDQVRYLAISKAQSAIKRGVRGSKLITYKPRRINSPGGPFVIGKPKR